MLDCFVLVYTCTNKSANCSFFLINEEGKSRNKFTDLLNIRHFLKTNA